MSVVHPGGIPAPGDDVTWEVAVSNAADSPVTIRRVISAQVVSYRGDQLGLVQVQGPQQVVVPANGLLTATLTVPWVSVQPFMQVDARLRVNAMISDLADALLDVTYTETGFSLPDPTVTLNKLSPFVIGDVFTAEVTWVNTTGQRVSGRLLVDPGAPLEPSSPFQLLELPFTLNAGATLYYPLPLTAVHSGQSSVSAVIITDDSTPSEASVPYGVANCEADITYSTANPGDVLYLIPDGKVDGVDNSAFVEWWIAPTDPRADINTKNTNPGDPGWGEPDGIIDGADLSYWVEIWLDACSTPAAPVSDIEVVETLIDALEEDESVEAGD